MRKGSRGLRTGRQLPSLCRYLACFPASFMASWGLTPGSKRPQPEPREPQGYNDTRSSDRGVSDSGQGDGRPDDRAAKRQRTSAVQGGETGREAHRSVTGSAAAHRRSDSTERGRDPHSPPRLQVTVRTRQPDDERGSARLRPADPRLLETGRSRKGLTLCPDAGKENGRAGEGKRGSRQDESPQEGQNQVLKGNAAEFSSWRAVAGRGQPEAPRTTEAPEGGQRRQAASSREQEDGRKGGREERAVLELDRDAVGLLMSPTGGHLGRISEQTGSYFRVRTARPLPLPLPLPLPSPLPSSPPLPHLPLPRRPTCCPLLSPHPPPPPPLHPVCGPSRECFPRWQHRALRVPSHPSHRSLKIALKGRGC